MTAVHLHTCPLCEAMCGLRIEHDNGEIQRISGDPDDPLSQGHICPKGVALQDLQHDPDRLRRPVRRTSRGFEELPWEDALDLAAEGLAQVRQLHGADALGIYLGNPNVHDPAKTLGAMFLIKALGTTRRFSATSVDQLPHHFVAYHCLGHQLLLPIPDIDRTDFLLMLGANPAASNGGIMSGGDIKARIRGIRERGGTVALLDPRRTETAPLATEHHFIRPGSDALLLAAMVSVLFAEDRVDRDRLPSWLHGVEAVWNVVAPFTPERVAPLTGLTADQIIDLARRFADARSAVAYGRMGLSTQRFGGLCNWLLLVLNAVTGNLDRPGGAMFTTPAVDIVAGVGGIERPGSHGRWHSRVRGLPEFGGELPVATLLEEITTPGPGRIRGLVTVAGNPVLSTPSGDALDAALKSLDFYVAVDFYCNESTRHADLILPPVGPLSRPHYDLVFNALAVRNVARFSEPLYPPQPHERTDWQILMGLEARLSRKTSVAARMERAARSALGPLRILDYALRTGPYGRGLRPGGLSLAELRRHPSGIDLGPLVPQLPGRLRTPEKVVKLAPEVILADLPRLLALLEAAAPPANASLRLIGRRELRSNNSWMHNSRRLVKGKPRWLLEMHPEDAAARDLVDGQTVEVRSRVGAVQVPVKTTDAVMPGVVCLPHGWGHGLPGVQLAVAQERPGANVNALTDPAELDDLSGNAVLNGVPVEVRAVG